MDLVALFQINFIQQQVQFADMECCALERWLISYFFNIIQRVIASTDSVLDVRLIFTKSRKFGIIRFSVLWIHWLFECSRCHCIRPRQDPWSNGSDKNLTFQSEPRSELNFCIYSINDEIRASRFALKKLPVGQAIIRNERAGWIIFIHKNIIRTRESIVVQSWTISSLQYRWGHGWPHNTQNH